MKKFLKAHKVNPAQIAAEKELLVASLAVAQALIVATPAVVPV